MQNFLLIQFSQIWKDIIKPNHCSILVKDIVVKSILSVKAGLQKEYEEVGRSFFQDVLQVQNPKVKSRYNCYMLLGYDILIDANLQPHLIGESWRGNGK